VIFVGIDPGVSGAIAAVHEGKVLLLADAPVIASNGKNRSHVAGMVELLRDVLEHAGTKSLVSVVLEQPPPVVRFGGAKERAGEGAGKVFDSAASRFVLGRCVGQWEGAVQALGFTLLLAHPPTWKKAMGVAGGDKGRSVLEASRLFPEASLKRKKDHGRADALLLAEYGRRVVLGRRAT